jgi:hypothetical protein
VVKLRHPNIGRAPPMDARTFRRTAASRRRSAEKRLIFPAFDPSCVFRSRHHRLRHHDALSPSSRLPPINPPNPIHSGSPGLAPIRRKTPPRPRGQPSSSEHAAPSSAHHEQQGGIIKVPARMTLTPLIDNATSLIPSYSRSATYIRAPNEAFCMNTTQQNGGSERLRGKVHQNKSYTGRRPSKHTLQNTDQ